MVIFRRSFVLAFVSSLAICPARLVRGASAVAAIGIINSVAELLGKCADGLSKLGDSFAHLTKLGIQAYDGVAARRTRASLVELRAQIEELMSGMNIPLVRSIEDYIKFNSGDNKPSTWIVEKQWTFLTSKIEQTAFRTTSIFIDVKKIRNDFVLDESYRALEMALSARITLLDQLKSISPPQNVDELEALQHLATEYQRVISSTQQASDQLASYIKALSR